MKTSSNKTKTIAAIAIILLMAFSAVVAILPAAFAQYTKMPVRDTQTEVAVSPTLIGLGQEVLINIMVYPGPSGPTYEAQYLVPSLNAGFANVSVTVTKPDGTKETFMPIDETLARVGIVEPGRTQIVGHLQFLYKPTDIGDYSITASFPGQTYTTDNVYPPAKLSVYYKPSSSTKATKFTVQKELVLAGILNGWPWSPLPTDYWERPVETDNREWYAISGDWVQDRYDILGTNYNPYSAAPNSPHILWARQVSQGGLIGGIWGSLPYALSSPSTIVISGKIYRNSRSGYFECVDLRTGKRLWEASGSITLAQCLDLPFQTATQVSQGAITAWLWGGTTTSTTGAGSANWVRYSPFNGDVLQNITNVPRDLTSVKFENGDPIVWCSQANLALWNRTLPLKLPYANLIKWNFTKLIRTVGYSQVYSNDWRDGIEWNVSIVQDDFVSIGDNNFRGPTCMPYPEANVVVVRTPNAMQIMAGYDYTTGKFLWKNNATVLDIDVRVEGIATSQKGPMLKMDGASPNYVAYDVKTGKEIWRAPSGELTWGMLPAYTFVYHNGVHFMGSYDGHVYAYSTANGKRVWQSDFYGEEFEQIYNTQPFNGRAVGADGKLYYSTATTYQMMPRPRFQALVCINETTGKFIWKLPIGIQPSAIADGYLLGTDNDNGIEYCIGKGKTTTTVTAPSTIVPTGTGVLIQGTVMDQSPGAPNTPAISDADMSTWMDYLYGQNATLINNPPKLNGVPVQLYAVGSDGSVTEIGVTTSDDSGHFSYAWTSSKQDTYKIKALFLGTESYWGSWAETSLLVGPAPEPYPEPVQPEPPIDTTPTIIGAAIAIIIAVAIATILILRKRP